MTQEYPLSVVLYGLILSVLAEQIRGEYPGLLQSFYADDFSIAGAGAHLKYSIDRIEAPGPARDFFIKPDK